MSLNDYNKSNPGNINTSYPVDVRYPRDGVAAISGIELNSYAIEPLTLRTDNLKKEVENVRFFKRVPLSSLSTLNTEPNGSYVLAYDGPWDVGFFKYNINRVHGNYPLTSYWVTNGGEWTRIGYMSESYLDGYPSLEGIVPTTTFNKVVSPVRLNFGLIYSFNCKSQLPLDPYIDVWYEAVNKNIKYVNISVNNGLADQRISNIIDCIFNAPNAYNRCLVKYCFNFDVSVTIDSNTANLQFFSGTDTQNLNVGGILGQLKKGFNNITGSFHLDTFQVFAFFINKDVSTTCDFRSGTIEIYSISQ